MPWVGTWHHYPGMTILRTRSRAATEKNRFPGNVNLRTMPASSQACVEERAVNTSLGSPLYIGADIKGSETLGGAGGEYATTRLWTPRGRGAPDASSPSPTVAISCCADAGAEPSPDHDSCSEAAPDALPPTTG